MAISPIPVKTPEGQAELGQRQRRLSQRHRTVLLLVDGRRTEPEVRSLARQAGAPDSCFGDLLSLGMIALPTPSDAPPVTTVPIPAPGTPAPEAPLHVDIPLDDLGTPSESPESVLPAARTLHPESVLNDLAAGDAAKGDPASTDFDALDSGATHDAPLEEARGILMHAVRREAPLTGSLTMLRLRRARTRGELADLIDEVETRIVKPYRSLAAQQVLRRARHLLLARADPQPAG